MIKEGDRVQCTSEMYSGAGEVVYINKKDLFEPSFLPIQVELDQGDADGHKIKRFSLKEVKLL